MCEANRFIQDLYLGESRRILFYGTSLTKSYGYWTKLLVPALIKASSGKIGAKQINTVNLGKDGQDSKWGLRNIFTVIQKNPDLVFIEFSINDAYAYDDKPHLGVTIERSVENLDLMIRAIRRANNDKHVHIMIMTMNPLSPIKDGAIKRQGTKIYDYYSAYVNYALRKDICLIDNLRTWKAILELDPERFIEYLKEDGVHHTKQACSDIIIPNILNSFGFRSN